MALTASVDLWREVSPFLYNLIAAVRFSLAHSRKETSLFWDVIELIGRSRRNEQNQQMLMKGSPWSGWICADNNSAHTETRDMYYLWKSWTTLTSDCLFLHAPGGLNTVLLLRWMKYVRLGGKKRWTLFPVTFLNSKRMLGNSFFLKLVSSSTQHDLLQWCLCTSAYTHTHKILFIKSRDCPFLVEISSPHIPKNLIQVHPFGLAFCTDDVLKH